jgi:hypothetical protein
LLFEQTAKGWAREIAPDEPLIQFARTRWEDATILSVASHAA